MGIIEGELSVEGVVTSAKDTRSEIIYTPFLGNANNQKHDAIVGKFLHMDVSDFVEKKKTGGTTLSYLSWADAWTKVLEACPSAEYEIEFFDDGNGHMRPYMNCDGMGFLVFTNVTIFGVKRRMWLPVMDGSNAAMKEKSYSYMVGKGEYEKEKKVEGATAFDINKTIMRCLVKNLAMFGLGLYIYAGEDLPSEVVIPCTKEQVERLRELGAKEEGLKRKFKVANIEDLTYDQAAAAISMKESSIENKG